MGVNINRNGHYWLAASRDPECDEAYCKGCGIPLDDPGFSQPCRRPHDPITGEPQVTS